MSDQPLRDVILLQADFLNTQAIMFDKMARSGEARTVIEQRLKTAARYCRQRATALNEVLAATEPKESAS